MHCAFALLFLQVAGQWLLILVTLLLLCLLLILCVKYRKDRVVLAQSKIIEDMIDAFSQSMFLLDANKVIIGIYNIMPEAMAGRSREDIVGKHLYVFSKDTTSPFYQACSMLDEAFDEVKRTGKSVHFEYMVDGAYLEALISEVGEGRVLSQVRDISELVLERKETVRMNQAELSVAMTAGGITSWRYDVESRMLNSAHNNPVVGNNIGLDEFLNCIQPLYRERVVDMFDQILKHGTAHEEVITQVRDLSGELRWTKVNAIPFEYDSKGRVKVIFGSQQDITKSYEAEKQMEWDRLKLQLAIRSGGMLQWEYSSTTNLFTILDRVYHMGQMRSIIHPEDYEIFEYESQQILSGREEYSQISIRLLDFNSVYRHYKANVAVYEKDKNGLPLLVTGLLINVSESVRMTEELIDLRDRAEESNRLKSAFLANMSHEIRTPLNAIVGFSNLMLDTENRKEMAEYQRIIDQNNLLLLTLIDDILDLSKIESGRITFSYISINVADLLSQLQQSTQLKAYPGVTVRLEEIEDDLVLVSDMTRLTQVIANFLNNAVKFTQEGEITIGCRMVEGGLRFHVSDTGTGISEKNLNSIFERFIKLDPNVPGTGLGLSICSTIVDLLGGTIGADSELGKGSTFWIVLPQRSEAS